MAEVKSFFDIVNILLEKKARPTQEEIDKHCNQFMVNMMLSCDQDLAGVAHLMSMKRVSNTAYFDCLYNALPKCKKFIKWNATKAKKEQDTLYLMDYYKCSQQTARQYLGLISETEMKFITNYYEKRGAR